MSALIDFLPILAFFVAYKTVGIWTATGVLMAATALQLAVAWLRTRRLSPMMLWSAVLVFAFGAVTLYFHNDLVLMWMPTALWVSEIEFKWSPFMANISIFIPARSATKMWPKRSMATPVGSFKSKGWLSFTSSEVMNVSSNVLCPV